MARTTNTRVRQSRPRPIRQLSLSEIEALQQEVVELWNSSYDIAAFVNVVEERSRSTELRSAVFRIQPQRQPFNAQGLRADNANLNVNLNRGGGGGIAQRAHDRHSIISFKRLWSSVHNGHESTRARMKNFIEGLIADYRAYNNIGG